MNGAGSRRSKPYLQHARDSNSSKVPMGSANLDNSGSVQMYQFPFRGRILIDLVDLKSNLPKPELIHTNISTSARPIWSKASSFEAFSNALQSWSRLEPSLSQFPNFLIPKRGNTQSRSSKHQKNIKIHQKQHERVKTQ